MSMFQEVSPVAATPLWLELTKAIVGPLIAAVVVIVGLIWRDRIERRNVAQAWFEHTYITEGLDVLMAHLAALRNGTFEQRRVIFADAVAPLPAELLPRLITLIPGFIFIFACDVLDSIMLSVMREDHPVVLTQDELHEVFVYSSELLELLETLRPVLLDIRIRRKRQVYGVSENPEVVKVVKEKEEKFMGDESLLAATTRLGDKYRDRVAQAAAARKVARAWDRAGVSPNV